MKQAIQTQQLLTLEKTFSQFELKLADGRSEHLKLESTGPVEFIVHEPVIQANGDSTIDLEILKFETAAVSKVLWPGETIKLSGGRNIAEDAMPIYGRVTIPAGKELADGVQSVQNVYLQFDTPIGKLHNVQAVPMVGTLTQIPPVGSEFHSTVTTELYDANMDLLAFVAACGSGTTTA